MTTTINNFDIRLILKLLPHRYPFLLVDRVIAVDTEKMTMTALKNITYNEPYFPGHFPGLPTMPGVLQLEAMAQTCGLLAIYKAGMPSTEGLVLYFAGIDNCRFKRPVTPGDQLHFHVALEKQKRDLWRFHTRATVGDDLASEADIMCVLRPVDHDPTVNRVPVN